jgi:hypothetical protein
MRIRSSRRGFLATAGAAALALPRVLRARAPNEKLAVACVGTGGRGWVDLHSVARSPRAEIAALCDVDAERLARAAGAFPAARTYADWRELLAGEGSRIDAVVVATPDHMHAPIAMTALRAGKHVFCEKPLAHDLFEARQLALAARASKVVTQLGIQYSSWSSERRAVALIQGGIIGKVSEVVLWSNTPPQRCRPAGPRPSATDAVPSGVAWDLWLGTAPERPFVADTYHPTFWRGWQDFGVGWLGDLGCHIWSAPHIALRLAAPLNVKAKVEPEWAAKPERRAETWPTWEIVAYEFPGTDLTTGKTIKATWTDGENNLPARAKRAITGKAPPQAGALFFGERGELLLPHQGDVQLFHAQAPKDERDPPPVDHYISWVHACLGEGRTTAPFEYAGPLTEIVLLGTVALRCPDELLLWDNAAAKFTNHEAADGFLRRQYRKGWEVEGL